MFVFLVPYRAGSDQLFRRDQIIRMINNISLFFTKHNIEYKIVISEQHDDNKFNRGLLLNAAFLEASKLVPNNSKYIHFNVDYEFNLERSIPDEFFTFSDGFLDLYRFDYPILGSACVFDSDSYRKINGFPNDLCGWGGDDWAIYNRIIQKNIPILTIPNIFNSGLVIDNDISYTRDFSQNTRNQLLAKRDDLETNGLRNCYYIKEGTGEFHDGNIIYHFLVTNEV